MKYLIAVPVIILTLLNLNALTASKGVYLVDIGDQSYTCYKHTGTTLSECRKFSKTPDKRRYTIYHATNVVMVTDK